MSFLKNNISRTIAIAIVAAGIGAGAGIAFASQPDMEGALSALKNAQGHLARVTQNKSGHASAARQLVGQAISEVEAGIAFGHTQGE